MCDSCWRWRRLPFIIYSTCAWPYICIYMLNKKREGGGSNGQGVSIDKVISQSQVVDATQPGVGAGLASHGLAKLLRSILLSLSSFFISHFAFHFIAKECVVNVQLWIIDWPSSPMGLTFSPLTLPHRLTVHMKRLWLYATLCKLRNQRTLLIASFARLMRLQDLLKLKFAWQTFICSKVAHLSQQGTQDNWTM